MVYKNQKQSLMTKEDTMENCPQYQKKYKCKPASPSSGREKMEETMSWRRVPKQKSVSKICVQRASHRLTEPDSTMAISVIICLFIGSSR